MTKRTLNRRKALQGMAAVGTAAVLPGSGAAESVSGEYRVMKGKLRQSVIHWCFRPMSLEVLAAHAARMGMQSVELVGPETWPALKKLGLTCAIAGSHGFAKGFAHREEHAECLASLEKSIAACREHGVKSVITFSGFRRGLSDEVARANMIEGLKKIAPVAEKAGVTVCLEMLNSRVNIEMKGHPDYFCDHIDSSVEIVKAVGSERVKVLFDIYHVQIMDGDVIRRIREHAPYIGHYHTAGNPGRNEIDETQEIQYLPIFKAIAETGYQGFVGHEFIPVRDPVRSLNEAVKLADV